MHVHQRTSGKNASVIGSGMIASAMAGLPFDVTIFAAGVADSACNDENAFRKEADLLTAQDKDRKLIYFSTLSVKQANQTPYTRHKLRMEQLIQPWPHLILRLPNLIGPQQNPVQLIPNLIAQIKRGQVSLHKNSSRSVIDVSDLRSILCEMLERNETGLKEICGQLIPVSLLITLIADILDVRYRLDVLPPSEYPVTETTHPMFDYHYCCKILMKYIKTE